MPDVRGGVLSHTPECCSTDNHPGPLEVTIPMTRLALVAIALLAIASHLFAAEEAVDISDGKILIPANHPHVQIIGRYDDTDPERPRFAFPGVSIRARFQADSITLLMEDKPGTDEAHINAYSVYIDNKIAKAFVARRGTIHYPIAAGLNDEIHTIEIRRRTEGDVGESRFLGFEIPANGKILEPPPRSPRRIQFVGDSITCGFGNMAEGDPPPMTFTSINEVNDLAYGSLTAALLGAEQHTIAYSGRGMFRSNIARVTAQIPAIYQRAVATDSHVRWDHSRWTPHVIVINVGTNDFGLPGLRDADFRGAYESFLDRLRSLYPEAQIVCCVGPMLTDTHPPGEKSLTRARTILTSIVEQRNAKGDARIHFHEFEEQTAPYGEFFHPTRKTHQRMAESLTGKIASITGWSTALSAARSAAN